MKKIIAVLSLILVISVSLMFIGCGDDPNPTPGPVDEKTPSLEVEGCEVSLLIGETFEIDAKVENIDQFTLEYTSSDSQIASVDKGIITANKVGNATITVKVSGTELEATVDVTVNGVPSLKLSDEVVSLYVDDEYKLEVTKEYIDEVVWTSSNETVATVDANGNVKAKASGTTVIKVSGGNLEASCTVEVTEDIKILVNGQASIYVFRNSQLTATLKGYSGKFTFESSDSRIAEVDENGLVKANAPGEVSIIISCEGFSTDFGVTVLPAPTIEVSGKNTAYIGKTVKLEATVTNSTSQVSWESSNPAVATVDANGLVTGVSIGQAFIRASVEGYTVSLKVEVIEEPDQVVLDFDGGVSKELYNASTPVASFTLNNYNTNSGAFWEGGYENYIYICDKENDPKATFSDRIYIGKNQYSGYYEIINILNSGASSWPNGAEYVIMISSSYSNYKSIHSKVLNLVEGQIVMIAASDFTTISGSSPSNVKFFNKEIDITKLTFTKQQFAGLPTPTRIGFTFDGWYNEDGEKVEVIEEVKGSIELKAKWNELNPVTDINVSKIKSTMTKGDEIQLESEVVPSNAYFKEIFYRSSDETLLSVTKDGYIVAKNAGKVILYVTDYVGRVTKEYEIVIYAESSVDVRFEREYKGYINAGETAQLTSSYYGRNPSDYSIKYSSNNPSVATVDENGLVTGVKNGDAVITVSASNGSKTYECLVTVRVGAQTISDRLDEVLALLAEYNFGTVETGNFCIYNDGTNRNYQDTYGSVNYYLFDKYFVHEDYYATTEGNPNNHKSRKAADTIEFVTVHDTATLTGTVVNIASNMAGGETSIHYTVGNNAIYGVVPENYIAYHAGDGTGYSFNWIATGVKAHSNNAKPVFTVEKSGSTWYFAVNGELTNIKAPISNGSKTLADPANSLSELGPVWTIKNGEYYMGPTWVCFTQQARGIIGSYGGNNNSIGIEMCVNLSGDMYDTLQRTAQLVADILIRNKLDLTRVYQHNTWTGKICPQVLIAGNYWDEFMKMVEINYILRKDYSDITITMKSNNPDIVDATGRVTKANVPKVTTDVSYEITVSDGKTSKSLTLYSVVPGSTTWEQWRGTYPSSKNWNNGNYAR